MAYGSLISVNHVSVDGRTLTVLLEQEAYGGSPYSASVELADPAYSLEYDNENDDEIGSLAARVHFVTRDSGLIAILKDMRFGAERDGRLTIKEGSDVVFQGYVIPDQVSTPLNENRTATVTIGAKDRTRSLDESWLDGSDPYEGDITASVLIADILASTGIPFTTIRVEQTWRPGNISFSADPYQIKIPAKNFYEYRDDGTVLPPTKKFVLEQVLGLTLCHLVQWDGMWHICQPMARYSRTFVTWHQYDASGTFISNNTLGGVVNLTNSSWIQDTDEGRSKPSYRSAQAVYAYGETDNQFVNGGFEVWAQAGNQFLPTGWAGDAAVWRSGTSAEGESSLAIETKTVVGNLSDTDATRFVSQAVDINQTTSEYELELHSSFDVYEKLGVNSYQVYKDQWAVGEVRAYYTVILNTGASSYGLEEDGSWTLSGEPKIQVDPIRFGFNETKITIEDFPAIGELTVRLYQGIHNEIQRLTDPPFPFPIVGAILWDGLRLRVVEDSDRGTANKSYNIFDSSKTEGKAYKKTFLIGDGPFQSTPGAIKYADGTAIGLNEAKVWRPVANASPAFTITELHAREFLRSRRNSQGTITFTLANANLSVSPIKAFEFDGKRYWPLRLSIEQPSGRATLLAREIRDDGVPSGRDVREDARVQISRAPDGAAIYSDLNPRIQNAFTLLSSAQTNSVILAGLRTTIPIDPVDSIFPAGTEITLVDSRTGNSFDLVVAANYGRFEPQIKIDPFTFSQDIDTESYIIISPAQALHRIAITENAYNRTMRSGRICALDGAVAGTVTSLTVTPTRRDIAKDTVLAIIEGLTASTSDTDEEQTVQSSAFVAAGKVAIPIYSARVDAPDGAHIQEDNLQFQSRMLQNPDLIQQYVEAQRTSDAFTSLSAAVTGVVTSLPVNAIPVAVSSGDKFNVIAKRTGTVQQVTLSAGASASATSLSVNSVDFTDPYPEGSGVRFTEEQTITNIASVTTTANANAAQVVLKAESTAGKITKLALVQLDSSVAGGSAITLAADQINIDGTTTFTAGYDPSQRADIQRSATEPTTRADGSALKAGDLWIDTSASDLIYSWDGAAWGVSTSSGSGNVTIRQNSPPSTRADGSALVEGDTWLEADDGDKPYTWTGVAWLARYTEIDGGSITTGTINASRVSIGSGTTYAVGYNPSTKTETQRQNTAPTTRSDGSALVEGDQWLEADDGDKPYTWNGASWVAAYTQIDGGNITTGTINAARITVGSGTTFDAGYNPSTKTSTQRQNTAPTTRADGSALVEGDIWLESDDGDKPYSWNGASWTAMYTVIDGGSITTGTIDASVVTVSNLNANNITTGELSAITVNAGSAVFGDNVSGTQDGLFFNAENYWLFNASTVLWRVGGTDATNNFIRWNGSTLTVRGALHADDIDASTLSAISADLGTITAGTITGGTFKTSAGTKRAELRSSDNELEFYEGSSSIVRIGSNVVGTDPGIQVDNGGRIAVYDNSVISQNNTSGLQCGMNQGQFQISQTGTTYVSIDKDTNGGVITLDEASGAPAMPGTGKWKLYFKSTGLFMVDDAGAETQVA